MDKHIETLVQRYPQLDSCKDDILVALHQTQNILLVS